jgi:hypothetical protein
MPRSVAKHSAPITSAVRTSSRIAGDSGATGRRYPEVSVGQRGRARFGLHAKARRECSRGNLRRRRGLGFGIQSDQLG